MIRRVALHAVVASLASVVLGPPQARAVETSGDLPRVGFVGLSSPSSPNAAAAFWIRLKELGYVEGQNLVIEARWAEGDYERLPALIGDLVGRKVDVIVTTATRATLVAKAATTTIPIVAVGVGDPVGNGLVPNLARPGGNLTGLSLGWGEGMAGKWLELLKETVPRLKVVAAIANPDNLVVRDQVRQVQAIAASRGPRIRVIEVRDPGKLERAFEEAKQHAQAVLVLPDPIIASMATRDTLTALAAKHRLPAFYAFREFVDAGGLMSYGPNLRGMYRRAAEYVDKILKGVLPGDLPVEQPTQFELVVNLRTARALGLTIPQSIAQRADELIR